MIFSLLLMIVSGISLMLLVLTLSLLLIGAENVLYGIQGTDTSLFAPYRRFLAGRCSDRCPPPLLYSSCFCLLVIFLFIPMGSFPQFAETEGDFIVVVFLLLVSQGLYIRGMKAFSGEIYQSFDAKELFVLSKFAVTLIAVGGTLSWYALNRGMPGNIFSLETFTATPIWTVTGMWGKMGSAAFLLLLVAVSPARGVTKTRILDNVQIPEIFDAIRSTIAPAMIVSLFFPMRLGIYFGLIGFRMYLVDFVSFWLRVMIVQVVLIPLAARAFNKSRDKLPERPVHLPEMIIGAAGIVFFMLDLYL
jgi:hypothetical protein